MKIVKFISTILACGVIAVSLSSCTDVIDALLETESSSETTTSAVTTAEPQTTTQKKTATEAQTEPETTTETETEPETTNPVTDDPFNGEGYPVVDDSYVEYHFRNKKYLDQHFDKHGSEFDYDSAEEYEQGASDVINNPEALYKIEQEDGDHVYYIEDTNEFVVLSKDGYIRTYFRPSAGIDYFNRQ